MRDFRWLLLREQKLYYMFTVHHNLVWDRDQGIIVKGDRNKVYHNTILGSDGQVIALLPGSRMGEVDYLGPEFMGTVAWLQQRMPELRVVVAVASAKIEAALRDHAEAAGVSEAITYIDGRSREVTT